MSVGAFVVSLGHFDEKLFALEESIDNGWVEVRSAAFKDDRLGLCVRHRFFVWATGSQRIIDIRERHDSRGKRNRFA